MQPSRREAYRAASRVGAVGTEFSAAVVVCLLAGWWADGKLGTAPWLALVGLIVGSVVGFRMIYRLAKNLEREAEEDEEA